MAQPSHGGSSSAERAERERRSEPLVPLEMERTGSQRSSFSSQSFSVKATLTDMAQRNLESAAKALEAKKHWAVQQKLADSERFHTTAAYPLRYLWHRPLLRQDPAEGDDHQENGEIHEIHEHWIELFNDLIMVAMLSNLAHTFEVGGQSVTNFALSVILWTLAMQSIHFVSYVVNLYQIDDLFLLLCCFCNTMGTLLMSASMKTDAHPPCTAIWYDNFKYVGRFEQGFVFSCASQLVILLQCALFARLSRNHVVVMAGGKVVSLLILLLVPGQLMKYLILAVLVVLVYVISWKFTNILALVDLHHLRGRMDLMVLVALGEWVITAILRETSFEMIVAQTALALMLAAEFFNTRQHGHMAALAMSARTAVSLLQLESIELVLLHAIAILLFFIPATIAVAEDYEDIQTAPHGSHGRALAAGHGHDVCRIDETWSREALRIHTAAMLLITRLMLLFLRHIRKCKIAELPIAGKKFYARVGLCFLHLLVPFVGRLGLVNEPKLGPLFSIHAAVMFIDLTAELSLHQLAARRVRRVGARAVAAVRRATQMDVEERTGV